MAYRTTIRGLTVWCDSVDELKALLADADVAALGGGGGGESDAERPPARTPPLNPLPPASGDGSPATRLLRQVHQAGPHGIVNGVLVRNLELASGRGLGPFMRGVERQLASIGMTADDVVQQRRGPDGRRWHAGPRIEEAIQRLPH